MLFSIFWGLVFGWLEVVTSLEEELERPNRIVGGDPVEPGTFPWQVSLQRVVNRDGATGESHFCGGTLVAEGWVLTAAHCTQNIDYSSVVVKTGLWDLRSVSNKFRVSKIFRDGYDPDSNENDIALLKLDLTNPLRVIQGDNSSVIPLEEEAEMKGDNCYVSGWGTLTYEGKLPEVLYAGKVSLKTDTECSSAFGEEKTSRIHRTNLCAGGGPIDSCQGDSGGPLVCCDDDSEPDAASCRLAGVTSWGKGCATPGLPGVYTEVAYFVKWIRDTIHKEGN